jgi:hypothetical protein
MPSWKRIVIISVSAGAGFALMLALIAGAALWYSSRPPRPWNASAIKATYDHIDTEGDKRMIVFYYILENVTATDYKVENGSNTVVAARLKRQNSLSVVRDEGWGKIDYPLFVPAKQRVLVAIHLAYPFYGKEEPNTDASFEDRRDYRIAVAGYVSKKMTNLDGFVLFDKANRYQINFPKGW